MAGVADRVLGEVLGNDPEHPRAQRKVEARIPGRLQLDPGPGAARRELVDHLLEHGQGVRHPQRDDLDLALELGEEQDLVDQLAGVLDLGPCLVEQRLDVRAREVGGVEQDEDACERGSQLVRDRSGEAGAERVERVLARRAVIVARLGRRHRLAGFGLGLGILFPEGGLHQIVTSLKPAPNPTWNYGRRRWERS